MPDNPIAVINYTALELNHVTAGSAAEGRLSSYLAPLALLVLMEHFRRQHLGHWANIAHKQGYRSE